MPPPGLEPGTFRLRVGSSYPLSYGGLAFRHAVGRNPSKPSACLNVVKRERLFHTGTKDPGPEFSSDTMCSRFVPRAGVEPAHDLLLRQAPLPLGYRGVPPQPFRVPLDCLASLGVHLGHRVIRPSAAGAGVTVLALPATGSLRGARWPVHHSAVVEVRTLNSMLATWRRYPVTPTTTHSVV